MVTGGLGFIGSNLARSLVDLGAEVLLVDSLVAETGANRFNIDDDRGPGIHPHRRRARRPGDGAAGRRPGRDLQPGRPGQPHRQHARPVHRPGHQLPGAAVPAGGVPPHQPVRQDRVRQHPPDLRPAGLPAGRREAPAPPDRRQRHQQDGRRVVPHPLQQRVRPAGLLAAPDQHLRPAGCWSRTTARRRSAGSCARSSTARRSSCSATARSSATSPTSTTPATRSCRPAPRTSQTARCSTSGGSEPISLRDLLDLMIEVAGQGSYRLVPFPEEKKAIDIGSVYADYSQDPAGAGLAAGDRTCARGWSGRSQFYRANRDNYWGEQAGAR